MARPTGFHLDVAAFDAHLAERRMSRVDAADAAGLAKSTVSGLCRTPHPLGASRRTAERLARALEVTAQDLFPMMTEDEPDELALVDVACLSVDQVAKVLNCSRSYVYKTISNGELRAIHLGNRKVVPVENLASFMHAGGTR